MCFSHVFFLLNHTWTKTKWRWSWPLAAWRPWKCRRWPKDWPTLRRRPQFRLVFVGRDFQVTKRKVFHHPKLLFGLCLRSTSCVFLDWRITKDAGKINNRKGSFMLVSECWFNFYNTAFLGYLIGIQVSQRFQFWYPLSGSYSVVRWLSSSLQRQKWWPVQRSLVETLAK